MEYTIIDSITIIVNPYSKFKKGGHYPIEKLAPSNIGKCGICGWPVVFCPILTIDSDGKSYTLSGYVARQSNGKRHNHHNETSS